MSSRTSKVSGQAISYVSNYPEQEAEIKELRRRNAANNENAHNMLNVGVLTSFFM
jgi:hypothetical protein